MTYGNKTNYRKINIYTRVPGQGYVYACSTTWSATCREAKDQFHKKNALRHSMRDICARFARA